MNRKERRHFRQMENHLLSGSPEDPPKANVYNSDKTDVSLEKFSQRVYARKKRKWLIWVLIALLIGALALFFYQINGGISLWS